MVYPIHWMVETLCIASLQGFINGFPRDFLTGAQKYKIFGCHAKNE